jgi:hypothetical protein
MRRVTDTPLDLTHDKICDISSKPPPVSPHQICMSAGEWPLAVIALAGGL